MRPERSLSDLLGDIGTIAKVQVFSSSSSWNNVKPGLFQASDATYIGIPSDIFSNYQIIGFKINAYVAIAFDIESNSHTIGYLRYDWHKY